MLIEFATSFAAGPGQCCSIATSSALMVHFPRVVVLLLMGVLVLFYGKTFWSSSTWKNVVSSTPAVAWVMAKFEKNPVKTLNKTSVQSLAIDHRLHMDSVAARRLSRDMFLATHSEFDFSVPPVRIMHIHFMYIQGFDDRLCDVY